MSLKERLAAKNASKTSTPASKLSGLKNRLGNRGGSSGGGLRDKFKRTKQDVLDQSYEDREKRSKMSSAGKPIFNIEFRPLMDYIQSTGGPSCRTCELPKTSSR